MKLKKGYKYDKRTERLNYANLTVLGVLDKLQCDWPIRTTVFSAVLFVLTFVLYSSDSPELKTSGAIMLAAMITALVVFTFYLLISLFVGYQIRYPVVTEEEFEVMLPVLIKRELLVNRWKAKKEDFLAGGEKGCPHYHVITAEEYARLLTETNQKGEKE